jgi:hypothetical protein
MDSPGVRKKMSDDASKSGYAVGRSGGAGGMGGGLSLDPNAGSSQIEKDNSRFVANQSQVTQQSIAKQDEQLDVLDDAVTRLHVIGENVHTGLPLNMFRYHHFNVRKYKLN